MSEEPVTLVEAAATRVRDPVSGRSVWLAKMVQDVEFADDVLSMTLSFQAQHGADDQSGIEAALCANLTALGFDGTVDIKRRVATPAPTKPRQSVPGMGKRDGIQPHGGPIETKSIAGVKHVIAVFSGKGGVGKSTVSTNLAVALRKKGLKVGLLDADIYGPSLPIMMNISNRPMRNDKGQIVPPTSYGVRCLSIGMLVDTDQAVMWRGPMVMNAIRQFLQETAWGELDVLVVDMPPGTGDAQFSVIQGVDLSGALIVTTPQPVALADAIRGVGMFQRLNVPLLGIVENMAYYQLPDGTKDFIFGEGGGKEVAERFDTPLLAQLPLQTSLRKSCDQGLPAALGADAIAGAFTSLAGKVMANLDVTPTLEPI
jgi:ATP-binding protein involved in chromosome partitioning